MLHLTDAEYRRMARGNGVAPDAFATLPPMTEKQLQGQIREVAKRLQMYHYHTARSDRSEPGFPDSLLVAPTGGTLWCLEAKIDTAHPTLAQQRWLDALSRVERVVAGVVRPASLAQWVRRMQEGT